jgi:hypothetical protein
MCREPKSLYSFCVCPLYSHFVFVEIYVNSISVLFKYLLFTLCRLRDHNRVTVSRYLFVTVTVIKKHIRLNSSTLEEGVTKAVRNIENN